MVTESGGMASGEQAFALQRTTASYPGTYPMLPDSAAPDVSPQ